MNLPESNLPETCPMSEQSHFYWENDDPNHGRPFPEVCIRTCSALWEAAIKNQTPDVDTFDHGDCMSGNLEYDDTMLQGNPDSPQRGIGILTHCSEHETDAFAEEYTFICPKG